MTSKVTDHVARMLFAFIVALSLKTPAQPQDSVDATNGKLPSEILAREIELQQLNQELNLLAANPSFNRTRRTWLWDFGNAIPTEGGLIAATALFHAHSSDVVTQSVTAKYQNGLLTFQPKLSDSHNHVPDSKVAGTIIPQIAGQVIGGTGSVFELTADYSRLRRLKKHGLDETTILRRVRELKDDIDKKLAQYSLDSMQSPDDLARANEIALLQQIRDKSLAQFCTLEAASSRNTIGRLIEDAASATRNTIGTVGNSINVAGIMQNNKRLNGRGSVLNLISASIITVRPFVSNGGSFIAKKASQKRTKFLNIDPQHEVAASTVGSELALLNAACNRADSDPGMKTRLAIYKIQCQQFEEDDSLAASEKRSATRQILRRYRESIYAPTKIAQSTTSVVNGFRDQNNATTDNRLSAAGNLTYCSGQVFNILELSRERVVDEERHAREKAHGQLAEQRITRSQERLQSMRAAIQ